MTEKKHIKIDGEHMIRAMLKALHTMVEKLSLLASKSITDEDTRSDVLSCSLSSIALIDCIEEEICNIGKEIELDMSDLDGELLSRMKNVIKEDLNNEKK